MPSRFFNSQNFKYLFSQRGVVWWRYDRVALNKRRRFREQSSKTLRLQTNKSESLTFEEESCHLFFDELVNLFVKNDGESERRGEG